MKFLGETPPETDPAAGGTPFDFPMPLSPAGAAGLTLLPPDWPPAAWPTGPATAPPPFSWEAVAWLEPVSALLGTRTPASTGAFPVKRTG